MGGECLKSRFPRIFAFALTKNMLVEETYVDSNGSCIWSVNLLRNLNDWKIRDYEELLSIVSQKHINTEPDQLLWKLKQNGEFSVRSFHKHIVREERISTSDFPYSQIWKSKVLPRIVFFFFFCVGG